VTDKTYICPITLAPCKIDCGRERCYETRPPVGPCAQGGNHSWRVDGSPRERCKNCGVEWMPPTPVDGEVVERIRVAKRATIAEQKPIMAQAMDALLSLNADERGLVLCWFCDACHEYVGPGRTHRCTKGSQIWPSENADDVDDEAASRKAGEP
jgi:hypothetical protein